MPRLCLGGDDWTVRAEGENGSDGYDHKDGGGGDDDHHHRVGVLRARVPGGIYSDLWAAGKMGPVGEDVYHRYNDVDFAWVGRTNWIYEKTFPAAPEEWRRRERVVLNLEGVDTVADVLLNGRRVGSADNMFVRHRFDVREQLNYLRDGEEENKNHLVVAFESPVLYAAKQEKRHSTDRYVLVQQTSETENRL